MDNSSSSSQAMLKQDNTLISKVKALVVRAWRERWNDVQWGIHLKKAIHTSPLGTDTKELAGINHIVLYFKYKIQLQTKLHPK